MDLGIEKSSIPDDGDREILDFRPDAMMDGRFRSLTGWQEHVSHEAR